ncbi:MAG: hypothetical protein HY329_21225 [Chloroflexi bacterium]|nr:hypothetical protein [Chloroflexota bacterium]
MRPWYAGALVGLVTALAACGRAESPATSAVHRPVDVVTDTPTALPASASTTPVAIGPPGGLSAPTPLRSSSTPTTTVPTPPVAPQSVERIRTTPTTATENRPVVPAIATPASSATVSPDGRAVGAVDLVGFWHSLPFVPAGFRDRYSFFADGDYVYLSTRTVSPDLEAGSLSTGHRGTWRLRDSGLELLATRTLNGDGTIHDHLPRAITVRVGPLEPVPPSESPYPSKAKIGGVYFWKYTSDPHLYDESDGTSRLGPH